MGTRHMSRGHTMQNIAHRDIAQLVRQLWVPEYEQELVTQSHPTGAALVWVCMPNEGAIVSKLSIRALHVAHHSVLFPCAADLPLCLRMRRSHDFFSLHTGSSGKSRSRGCATGPSAISWVAVVAITWGSRSGEMLLHSALPFTSFCAMRCLSKRQRNVLHRIPLNNTMKLL
jgi:hypothetical protein